MAAIKAEHIGAGSMIKMLRSDNPCTTQRLEKVYLRVPRGSNNNTK